MQPGFMGPWLADALVFGGMTIEGDMKSLQVSVADKLQDRKSLSLTLYLIPGV